MSQKIWEINGLSLELDLDLEDAEMLERYEDAFDAMAKEEKEIPKDGKKSMQIREYCALFDRLYDWIFGSGTSEKIFKGIGKNAEKYDEIYAAFLDFVRAQTIASAERKAKYIQKYIPQNRKQKRASK